MCLYCVFTYQAIYRGYYMAAWRYEISLRVLRNIFNTRREISYLQAAISSKHQWNTKPFHLRCLNTVLAVCRYLSFANSWQEKGCSSRTKTWQVNNMLIKDFDWQVKCNVFVVSMATWAIEYNLKISLLLSLHKISSLDFPINLHTAYYN